MKRFFFILIIGVLVFWITSTFAQSEPPPPTFSGTSTYTDTTTPLPSATSTASLTAAPELPTLTNTPVPTLEPSSTAIPIEPDLTSTATDLPTSATPSVIVLPTQDIAPTEPVLPTDTASDSSLVQPTSTTASFPTPTEFVIPSVGWVPVRTDSFDNPHTADWSFTGFGWGYTSEDGGNRLLQVFNSDALAMYGSSPYADVATEITVDVSAGAAHLYARSNGALGYEARITSTGNIALLRAGVILTQMQLPDFVAAMPHQLRLSVYSSQVWVDLDGQTRLIVNDPEPLPPGAIGLSASFSVSAADFTPVPPQHTVRFDDFIVYRPVDQVTATPVFSPTPFVIDQVTATLISSITPLPSETPVATLSVTPSFPPMQRPALAEARMQALTVAEPIEIPNNNVDALIDAMSVGGAIIINLAEGGEYTLPASVDYLFADTGLPVIRSGSDITINGRDATIRAGTSGFRIFGVDQGTLTLNNLILRDATLFTNGGAAVSNSGGYVTLNNVLMENNRVEGDIAYGRGTGGAVYTYFGYTTITNSAFINNYAIKYGGGLYSWGGDITVINTRFEGNSAGLFGGAIGSRDAGSGGNVNGSGNVYIDNSAAQAGGAFYIESGSWTETGALITDNVATTQGGVLFSGVSGDPVGIFPPHIRFTRSDITGNTSPLIVSDIEGSSIDFDRNWWGDATGPAVNDLVGYGISASNPLPGPLVQCGISIWDNDGDCLPDAFELAIPGLSPTQGDSDGDGIPDGDEDYDSDGLSNIEEYREGTQPTNSDTDQDGLSDGLEINTYETNPHVADSDGDGLLDGFEVNRTGTNPLLADSDENGIDDGDEDFDGDGLSNLIEQLIGTHPLQEDSDTNGTLDGDEDFDSDGLTNLQELNLFDPEGTPLYDLTVADSDGNGSLDGNEDPDADGLVNQAEFSNSADPLNPDTDGDRLPDGFEVNLLLTNPAHTDTDTNGTTDDYEDPDGDGLNNYQEFRLGTDPFMPTTLGSPSRLRSETILMPQRATANGESPIQIVTIVRDAQGRFLPNYPVTWTTINPNFILSRTTDVTSEDGVATVSVTSGTVSSGVVEIHASEFVVGRPLLQFIGGDPGVRFTSTSSISILPAQVVNAVFEVSNDGVLPIANIEVAANLPFGMGVIEAVAQESDVELRGHGNNSATWNIPVLGVGERRTFSIRFRVGSTLGMNTQIPLTVQTSSIEDTNSSNNSASFSARIVPNLDFPSTDQQSEKLSVAFTSDETQAAVGQSIELTVVVENLSSEPLFNLTGFAPLLGNTYPNVVFTWGDPARPGYLAPAGNGAASQAVATIAFTVPAGFPSGLNRVIAVQAIDADPSDGSSVVIRDSLTDGELSVRGPNLQVQLTSNRSSAGVGDEVTFTLTLTNSALATDTATNLQVVSNLMSGTELVDSVPPGTSKIFQFTHTVNPADVPQLTAQVLLTGQGLNEPDVSINYSLRRTISVIGTNIAPDTANLVFQEVPTLAFLPGRTTPLPLTAQNMGMMSADNVQLRVNVPYGVDVDVLTLAGGVFDSSKRIITWNLGTLGPNETHSVTPAFITPNDAILGSELIFDAVLSTTSDEITLDDNQISPAGTITLPAPTNVAVTASSRNWLIADNRDRIALEIVVSDQLDTPLPNAEAVLTASLPGLMFDPATLISDADGRAITEVQATEVGTVNVVATFSNGAIGSTTLHRRDSAVSISASPDSIGIGGQDRYTLFVVNTATLPDGTTATGDLVDLTFTLPTELPVEWFQFEAPTLPLGFGDFTETHFTVTLPPTSALPDCQALVGTYPFTVTATGRTLGVIGEAQGQLTIVAEPPELTNVVPGNGGRIGGDRVLFSWRSNTPGESTVYYRRQGEANYTPLLLTADALDARLYSAVLDITGDPEGTVYQWYGETSNGCSTRSIGTAAQPQTFTRVRSTTFADTGYAFTITDDYDVTTTTANAPLAIRIRNDDDVSHTILVDVENPYSDLTLGFIGSGSVDQVMTLAPGQIFSTRLRVFPQDTKREFYSLTLRLENDEGDVDRVPLVVRVQQPHVDLDIQVLEIDPRTLVTRARLTNRGDTLTDLTLDIVQDSTGIPANFVIQPDIQHTYLRAGQSLEISFIPLDLQDTGQANAAFSAPTFDPLTGTSLNIAPSLASISGPYRITASARNITIPNVTLRDGTLTNTCGADGSERTIAADCTVPAGTETRVVNGWYCTNRPNFDVAVSLALPNGGLGIPITNVSVGANFSPGGGAYTHSTTVSLNGSLVGSAIVPSQSRIQGNVAPQTLILGGSSPTQLLNLRSTHTNGTHYTVASGFTVTVDYDEHTRTGCFTQAEIDAAAGGTLMCAPDSSLIVPLQELSLNLTVDPAAEAPQNADGAFVFTVGEQIPLIAEVSAVGQTNLTDPVEIELSVPRGLRPQGMTIQNEDPIVLSEIFETLVCLVTGDSNCGNLLNDIVEIALTPDTVRYTYTIEEPVIVGQPFPITLEVIGEVVGTFTLSGQASLSPSDVEGTGPFSFDSSSGFQVNANSVEAFLSLQVTPSPADYYTQFRGIIFWAIYNETNENQQIPLSEALPGVETSIPNSITNQDHRYLMARTILNNIPFEDVSAGVAYMRRWGGSIGDTSYRLWSKQGGRVACEFEGEPIALSYATAAGESDAAIVRWFNGYMECLRTGQPLENRQLDYDEAYGDITGFIDAAIADHVNGASNPIPGAEFVKHTSTCFVWQRDSSGRLTSCHGDRGRINMQTFCDASPYVASPTDGATPTPTPAPNRNCRSSSINPSSVVVTEWLASDEGHDSNQQLGLETVVGWRNLINLGFYRPDQPLRRSDGSPTSGQGCENNCYFLLGNPILEENGHLRESIDAETRTEAWERHEAAQINPDYGYRGNAQSYLVHVLREEDSGDETWITTVFQQGAN